MATPVYQIGSGRQADGARQSRRYGTNAVALTGLAGIALGGLIQLPLTMANTQVTFALRLLREDGQPVTQRGPLGDTPVLVDGEFEVGRPPGLKHGHRSMYPSPSTSPHAVASGGAVLVGTHDQRQDTGRLAPGLRN